MSWISNTEFRVRRCCFNSGYSVRTLYCSYLAIQQFTHVSTLYFLTLIISHTLAVFRVLHKDYVTV